jgi:spore germination protein
MPRRATPLLVVLLVALGSCGLAPPSPFASPGALVIVTSAGTQLDDGATDVPPTLDLGVEGDGVVAGDVRATLDGRPLQLDPGGGGLTAAVPPMPYGSRHTLVVDIAGRDPQTIGFQVIDRSQVSAAAWLTPSGEVVCQAVFEWAPDRSALAAALPGARLTWIDPTRVSIAWTAPPAQLTIPAGLPAARGSVLQGPLTLSITGLGRGRLRRATVPPAAPAPAGLSILLWTVPTAASRASARAHAASASVLSPTGWEAGADGSLRGAPDGTALRAARAVGRPAWPMLADDASDPSAVDRLLNNPSAEVALVTAVAAQVRQLGLGGVNLDFEGVPGGDRGQFTGLVTQLAAALHAEGVGLSVDVVPHAPGDVNAASAAYDDAAIARVADRLVVMAYDEHWAADAPGPVAGIDWQAGELAGTIAGVPTSKVVLGIPLYARRWSGGQVSSSDYASAVAQALSEPDVRYGYDFGAATPELTTDPGGVSTELWFDDADSLLRKIDAVRGLGLAGIAAWRAGFEDAAFWSAV